MHLVTQRRQCRYEAGQVHGDSHPGAVVIAKVMMCALMLLSWKNSHMEWTGSSSVGGLSMVPGNSEAMDHLCVHDLVNYISVHVLVNINSKKGVDRLQNSKKGSTVSDVGIRECWKTSRY